MMTMLGVVARGGFCAGSRKNAIVQIRLEGATIKRELKQQQRGGGGGNACRLVSLQKSHR